MTSHENILKQYRAEMAQVLRLYVCRYFEKYSEERNLDTACSYLKDFYEIYRSEVTNIYINSVANFPQPELRCILIEQTKEWIGLLFAEIMLESTIENSKRFVLSEVEKRENTI